MIVALLLGTGLGLGLWALVVGWLPPRPPLGAVLARVTTPPAPRPSAGVDPGVPGWVARLARPAVTALQALGLPRGPRRRDLAVLDRPISTHLTQQTTGAVAGLLTPLVAGLLATLGGLSPGVTLPVLAAPVLAATGFWVPELRVRAQARRARDEFRHGLSVYLDLVAISLAGGAGVHSALHDAARIGNGWAFTQIRRALDAAQLTRTTPWATLRQLGEHWDIPELAELAASVSLAGTEGARVRASLETKAAALRTHQLTDTETAAQAATERMSLPVVALFLGFLVFLGYPALIQILTSL